MSEQRLREYVENDKIYQEYKKNHTEANDFERFCFTHCRDIENVLDALDEIREYIKSNYLFNYVYDEEELFEITSDRKAKEDLLKILDKVMK